MIDINRTRTYYYNFFKDFLIKSFLINRVERIRFFDLRYKQWDLSS